jgi:hypothetical protein
MTGTSSTAFWSDTVDVFTPPSYAVGFDNRGVAYQTRREPDRHIQEPSAPFRSNRFNALGYSVDTFPNPYPPLLPSEARAMAPTAAAAAAQAELHVAVLQRMPEKKEAVVPVAHPAAPAHVAPPAPGPATPLPTPSPQRPKRT